MESGVPGRLVSPGNLEALSETIAAVLADPDGARAMGEAGRARDENAFDIGV